ncbi:MAG: hypothetical protein RLN83_15610 [Balneola sp.]
MSRIGPISYSRQHTISLDGNKLIDVQTLSDDWGPIGDFLKGQFEKNESKLVWLKINVIDQAINDYVGIGMIGRHTDWLRFITSYLSADRADQSGDSIIVLFDRRLSWAISFTISQDHSTLTMEKFG